MPVPAKKSCDSDCCVDETKYEKRNKQRRKKMNKALSLFAISLTVLAFTRWVLKEGEKGSSSSGARDNFELFSREKMENLKHAKDLLQEGIKNGLQHGGGLRNRLDEGALRNGMSNFLNPRGSGGGSGEVAMQKHEQRLAALDAAILMNKNSGTQWMNPEFLPSLVKDRPLLNAIKQVLRPGSRSNLGGPRKFFKSTRRNLKMKWEDLAASIQDNGPKVDFNKHSYKYPEKLSTPPERLGDYPKLRPLRSLMESWPQDDIDLPPTPFEEVLIHFDFTDPGDLAAAEEFRDAELPFKFVNVPDVVAAGSKWTDGYLNENFQGTSKDAKRADGKAQESISNFFSFFVPNLWDVELYGLPPTRNNDFSFERWARHARFADAVGLGPNQPHFYWQSGVDREERMTPESEWTFISKDLPSFSSPTKTFFVFHPEMQKGIQCRFGERGVTAATHYDNGRNMVAMITGAKRYVLSPPRECPKLGIVPKRGNSIFRHSSINFGHINLMDDPDMPQDEREWLEESGDAMSVETILKAGEVLYIPSHWFHYITSLQKSAQCNVRSGINVEGDKVFGGQADVTEHCDPVI